jgi:hypothetical protein
MTDNQKPLIPATHLNRILLIAGSAIATALLTFLANSVLETKSRMHAIEVEATNFHEWLTGIDSRMDRTDTRIDRLYQDISRLTLIKALGDGAREETESNNEAGQ